MRFQPTEVKAARAAVSGNAPSAEELAKMTPVLVRARGFSKRPVASNATGQDGKGGVANFNAKTAEQVPSLIYVADGYNEG